MVLLTLCRRIISYQIKESRRRRSRPRRQSRLTHGPVPAYLRSTPSVRELVTALISSLSTLHHINYADYNHSFCAITFLDETTQAVGIPTVTHFMLRRD